ncbi:MAG: N-glycosylase/DNA lyase [Nanoarchaeota archaeon]|nr:N-glycosylase/DNA lyase [Nanoarchaeota archaeon]
MLLKEVKRLQNSPISKVISNRIKEFKSYPNDKLFQELSFCLMTANFNAKRAINIQDSIKDGFNNLSEKQLSKKLKELGHRFPNARAKYIVEARKHDLGVIPFLEDKREYLVNNVKGLGFKEASHFLRNIGYSDFAIIDFHIVDLLVKNKLIERPKTLNKNKYLEIESLLSKLAAKLNLNLDELDLYLWYLETGKVLK